MKHLLFVPFMFFCFIVGAWGQATGIEVVVDTAFYATDPPSEIDPTGMMDGFVSYLVYAQFTNPTDVLGAVFSDVADESGSGPMFLDAPCGCFNPVTTSPAMDATNNSLLWQFPNTALYEYDTFWTIGKLSGDAPGQNPTFLSMPQVDGANICSDTLVNASLFLTGAPVNAVAGDDLRIAVARVTTCGDWSLNLNLQVFIEGDQGNNQLFFLDAEGGAVFVEDPCENYAEVEATISGNVVLCSDLAADVDMEFLGLNEDVATTYSVYFSEDDFATEELLQIVDSGQFLGLLPGAYRVEVVNEFGCRDTTEFDVVGVPTPEFVVTNNTCLGESGATVFLENPINYWDNWIVEAESPSGEILTPAVGSDESFFVWGGLECLEGNGIYVFSVSTFEGCVQAADTILVKCPDACGVCDGDGVSCFGCTEPDACNYDPTAYVDDLSCFWASPGYQCPGDSSLCGSLTNATLTVEAFPAISDPLLTVHRLYLDISDIADDIFLSALYAEEGLVNIEINADSGVFNSPLNPGWNALGINPSFFATFPELADDTYLTLGLDGPAYLSGISGASDPYSIFPFENESDDFNSFFSANLETHLSVTDGALFITNTSYEQSIANLDGRVFVGQLTTQGSIEGVFAAQILNVPGTPGYDQRIRYQFSGAGVFNGSVPYAPICGCTNSDAVNYLSFAELDDGSCLFYCAVDLDADGICDDVDDCVGEFDECGVCNGLGAVFVCGCEDLVEGQCDCEGNFLDSIGICGGECFLDANENGICDENEFAGCTYELAENYASEATYDDGSCIFPCEGVVNTNVFDWDGDYVVTVTDFLMMLSVYGDTDVDLDGVWDSGDDCVDTNACNYANDPSEPCAYIDVLGVCGGGCEGDEDSDGICDDIDTCIGVEDECGVCNGPGPTEVVIEDILITYDSVFLPLDNDWYVFPVSADTTFSYTCAPFFGGCGDPVGYQGYDYATVLIGDQCWFAENLRSENYENGDAIPAGLSNSEWSSTTSGAVAVYGASASSLEAYGRLYNWYAVDDARGLCPSGWHVPTDGEWMTMEMALGMSEAEANDTGYRGTDQGTQMKTDYGWPGGGNGTNSSGFSGLPGGLRSNDGSFISAGYDGGWWSSSPIGSYAWYRGLSFNTENVDRSSLNQRYGFSVRCVRDAE